MTLVNGKRQAATMTISKKAYAKLIKIAKDEGLLGDGRENFDTHNSDSEDFIETSVWTLNKILQAAYTQGYKDAQDDITKDLKQDGVTLIKPSQKPNNSYKGEWKTAKDIVSNIHTKRTFGGWGETTLAKITNTAREEDYKNAHKLWLKLKEAFNAEAATYNPNGDCTTSRLGSIGEVKEREVMRSAWWDELDGDKYGDYDTITLIIELLFGGTKLKTGRINFGS